MVACVEVDNSSYRNGVEMHTNPPKSEAFLLPRVLTNKRHQDGIVFPPVEMKYVL